MIISIDIHLNSDESARWVRDEDLRGIIRAIAENALIGARRTSARHDICARIMNSDGIMVGAA